MWIVIVVPVILFYVYYYIIKPLKYWEERNVQHVKPIPIFGNALPMVLKKRSAVGIIENIYHSYPDARYVGMYNFSTPTLVIKDPELIKIITIKEFDTFPERRQLIPNSIDNLWDKNLFAIKGGPEWHELRSTLSPTFTSGKMKAMFGLIRECSKKFVDYYKAKEEINELNAKDVFGRYASDATATYAFGFECDSHADRENEFYLFAKKIINFDETARLAIFLNFFSPKLEKFLRIPIINAHARKYFTELISETLRIREENKIVRPDMIHLLMQARKCRLNLEKDLDSALDAGFAATSEVELNQKPKKFELEITNDCITAQALIFCFAGIESVSTLISYAIYELAINPDIQEKLREEIDDNSKNSNEELTYENLMAMEYLDMVVSETLRKWPPAVLFSRKSVKPYVIKSENLLEKPLYLKENSVIVCPTFSIHRDEKYYLNPTKFDPERFSEKNRCKINPCAYIPFGFGPRNCIGSRFSLLTTKLVIAETIKNFEVVSTAKTHNPILLNKTNFNLVPEDGIWIGLKKRCSD